MRWCILMRCINAAQPAPYAVLIWFLIIQVWATGRCRLMAVSKALWYTSDTGNWVTGTSGRNGLSISSNVRFLLSLAFYKIAFRKPLQWHDDNHEGSILDKWRKFKVNSKPAGPAGYSLAALILTATAQHAAHLQSVVKRLLAVYFD